eukprot:g48467.t1
MRLREFFRKPNETTNKPAHSERFVVQQPKKSVSNWTPLEGSCPRLNMYAQAVRRCVNARFIGRTQEIVLGLIKTFDPDLQNILGTLILHTSCTGDSYCLQKMHKATIPGHPITTGNGTLCENLSGYGKGILKPI